jgi:hypothetical protein
METYYNPAYLPKFGETLADVNEQLKIINLPGEFAFL